MNTFTTIGNLTRDPELKYVNDKPILNMSIAENKANGVNYWDIAVFGKTAENCVKYLNKGSKVCVTGSLDQKSWEKDGVKITKAQVIANYVEFLSTKNQAQDKPEEGYEKAPF